jgi:hypothetical protein
MGVELLKIASQVREEITAGFEQQTDISGNSGSRRAKENEER